MNGFYVQGSTVYQQGPRSQCSKILLLRIQVNLGHYHPGVAQVAKATPMFYISSLANPKAVTVLYFHHLDLAHLTGQNRPLPVRKYNIIKHMKCCLAVQLGALNLKGSITKLYAFGLHKSKLASQ